MTAEGVTFPVQLDYPVDQANAATVQEAQSFKQSVEASLGKENVIVNVLETETSTHEAQGFYAETPEQQDYDIISSWWGPDYQDPRTYLDIMSPVGGGSVIQNLESKQVKIRMLWQLQALILTKLSLMKQQQLQTTTMRAIKLTQKHKPTLQIMP